MKNIDVVNKIVASKHGKDERTVKLINAFYWKIVRSKMVNAEVQAIAIKGLCTFPVSKYNLYKAISSTIKKIRYLRTTDKLPEESKNLRLKIQINRLKTFLKRRNEIAQQYYDRRIYQATSKGNKEL
jgi:ethanolamine utilization cobalamin adenosyltransferase